MEAGRDGADCPEDGHRAYGRRRRTIPEMGQGGICQVWQDKTEMTISDIRKQGKIWQKRITTALGSARRNRQR